MYLNNSYFLIPFIALAILSSCSSAKSKKAASNDAVQQVDTLATPVKALKMPAIPSIITEPDERATYLSEHFWDNYDFADTSLISKHDFTEQAMSNFIQVLTMTDDAGIDKAIESLFKKTLNGAEGFFDYFSELFDKYLYNPNSPMLNEELYIHVLNYFVNSPDIDPVYKIRPEAVLEMAMKNRVGQQANDFVYTLDNGKKAKMHDLKADYTILFFNNPDCHDCARVKTYISESQVFKTATSSKNTNGNPVLAILAVYPDADLPAWKAANYPKCMINSYDAGGRLTKDSIYSLRAIPTLYLLDKNKTVIYKDATVETIEQWLANNLF